MSDLKKDILQQVCKYLYDNGITIDYYTLDKHIIVIQPPNKIKKKKFKFNPNPKIIPNTKIKFIPKSKFTSFIDICHTHNFEYFHFYDIHSWSGPAIKLKDLDSMDLFNLIDTTIINGYGFYIIRPTIQCKDNISYPKYNNTLESNSLILNNSDDDELELDEWYFHDVKYLLDSISNHLYCYQTNEHIGKKIDEFNIQLF